MVNKRCFDCDFNFSIFRVKIKLEFLFGVNVYSWVDWGLEKVGSLFKVGFEVEMRSVEFNGMWVVF